MTGSYEIRPLLEDFILKQNDETVIGSSQSIWLENLPPSIVEVTGPDTVWVYPTETDTIQFDIRCDDDQSVLDLGQLELLLTRRNSADDGDTLLLDRFYYDDGLIPDTLAEDGVFSAAFTVNRESKLNIPFTFSWIAYDKVGQVSDTTRNQMVITLIGNQSPRPVGGQTLRAEYVPIEEVRKTALFK